MTICVLQKDHWEFLSYDFLFLVPHCPIHSFLSIPDNLSCLVPNPNLPNMCAQQSTHETQQKEQAPCL